MKKIKLFFLFIFACFLFVTSDRLIIYMENNSPLMKELYQKKNIYESLPVNAIIKDNTIIPGMNGKVVNIRESYLKMNDFGTFNEIFLVYDYIIPDVSINNNLDKIIIKGNKEYSVSLIVNNDSLEKYLNDNNIYYSKLVKKIENNNNVTYINGYKDADSFNRFSIELKKNNMLNKICFIDYHNYDNCVKNKYYILKYSIYFDKYSLAKNINLMESGDIIYIDSDITLDDLKLILNKINKSGLRIIKLSDLIVE